MNCNKVQLAKTQSIDEEYIKQQVLTSLYEDSLGLPDRTAQLIDENCLVKDATIVTNQAMTVCGIAWVNTAFALCSKDVQLSWFVSDGDQIPAKTVLCKISGPARAILTAERVALNFLQTLSATATTVTHYVNAVKPYAVKIMDTRKTIPGLRLAQKYAVTVGGGFNQRLGLHDAVLIKENHIAACGGVRDAFLQALKCTPADIQIQIEVETFAQFELAFATGAKLILLDNMSLAEIKRCVEYNHGVAELEISGGVTLDNIKDYAATGVSRISVGALTKNIAAIDLTLRLLLRPVFP